MLFLKKTELDYLGNRNARNSCLNACLCKVAANLESFVDVCVAVC